MSACDLLAQGVDRDAGAFRARLAMGAEAEAELAVQPAVRAVERELVMKSMRIGQEARRFQRDAADRIADVVTSAS